MKLQARNVRLTVALTAAFMLMCVSVGSAQTPQLPEIPEELSAEAKGKLQPERDRLVNERSVIRAGWAEHEKKCRSVVAGSADHTACLTSRDALVARRAQLRAQEEGFRATFRSVIEAEIAQIEAQESALSQAIQAGLEKMRSMADQATETAEDQLQMLHEEIKKQLEERKRYRVRRTAVASAVRG